jgi:FkbM family methyltransferase
MRVRERVVDSVLRHHGRLATLLPRGYHAYPGRGGWIFLDVRESPAMLARALWSYEVAKSDALAAAVRPGAVVLDIGGNKGDFSLLAAKVTGDSCQVLCFEPAPENAAWIERSLARNGYRCVEVIQVAVSDTDGDATLHLSEMSGWHSLVASDGGSVGEIAVRTRRLDALLAERGISRVDVVKIDVEGAEESVLAGAASLLSEEHPMTVLLDLHPPVVDPVKIANDLRGYGFEIRRPERSDTALAVTPNTRELIAIRR